MVDRPTPEEVAEDAGTAIPQYETESLARLSVDQLVDYKKYLEVEIRTYQGKKTATEQELWRRAQEARPEVATAGTAVLAGDHIAVTVGADRSWNWNERALQLLGQDEKLLTAAEYSRLVTWTAKVDGSFFNTLLRRGGDLATRLLACRTLRSSRPTFEVRARR